MSQNTQNSIPDITRRQFTKSISMLPFLVSSWISEALAWNESVIQKSIFKGLSEKYEDYQEDFLLHLDPSIQQSLLQAIARRNPALSTFFTNRSDANIWKWHLLRVGFMELFVADIPKISPLPLNQTMIEGKNILTPEPFKNLRQWPPGYLWHQVRLPKTLKNLSPFNIIPAEQRSITINGTYGVFESGNCIESTWNGKETWRILMLQHGDIVEIPPGIINFESGIIGDFSIPKPTINPKTGTTLCSQTVYLIGKQFWIELPRWASALGSLSMYPKKINHFPSFQSIPTHIRFVDIFMRSKNNPNDGHRAIGFRHNNGWNIIDPYSHNDIVSPLEYKRKHDIITLIGI